MALMSGCMGVRWSATNKAFDAKGRMLMDANQIVIETPDGRLPENEILTFNVQWRYYDFDQRHQEYKWPGCLCVGGGFQVRRISFGGL